MLNRHYLDELAYLRDLGREFARAHPEIAGQLGEAGTDPDVERLLEGVAFIGARSRPSIAKTSPVAVRTNAKQPPPIPELCPSTTDNISEAAMAASIALPPRSKASIAARLASG